MHARDGGGGRVAFRSLLFDQQSPSEGRKKKAPLRTEAGLAATFKPQMSLTSSHVDRRAPIAHLIRDKIPRGLHFVDPAGNQTGQRATNEHVRRIDRIDRTILDRIRARWYGLDAVHSDDAGCARHSSPATRRRARRSHQAMRLRGPALRGACPFTHVDLAFHAAFRRTR